VEPTIVKENAFGDGPPTRDLHVSPEHAFYLDGLLYKAEDLVNDDTIIRTGETPVNVIEYFHIDLGFHDLVYAEGAATESFGGVTREHFDNCKEFYELYGRETVQYEPFAPNAYKRSVEKLGSRIGKHIPAKIKNLAKPLARKVYSHAHEVEKRFQK